MQCQLTAISAILLKSAYATSDENEHHPKWQDGDCIQATRLCNLNDLLHDKKYGYEYFEYFLAR